LAKSSYFNLLGWEDWERILGEGEGVNCCVGEEGGKEAGGKW
jgi:hypothetical protein